MILGNPYKFAIIIQTIKQWNKEESADNPFCNQYYVFAVSDGTNIRILASKLKYIKKYSNHKLKNINVNEAIISMKELNDIIYKLEKFDYFHDVT